MADPTPLPWMVHDPYWGIEFYATEAAAVLTCLTEAEAVRALAAHLADEHGVMVIRSLIVTDVEPCERCDTGTIHGGMGCSHCDELGEIRRERPVSVDQYTVEAT